ncbi:MAG: hypothetical protein AAFO94_20780, partial [Bacteroidota bacterium]
KSYHSLSTNLIYSLTIKKTPVLIVATVANIFGRQQVFGYEYAQNDFSVRRPVKPLYNRFIFLGGFINLGFDKSDEFIDNILNN